MRKLTDIFAIICVLSIFSCMLFSHAAAEITEQRYYIGFPVNTDKDTGYSESNKIDADDPHFGWSLGRFYINGYTRVIDSDPQRPVFLKTVGDKITLWFNLEQDINMLNGDEELIVCEDKNGYDEYFEIPKTNFGRGVLIIRHTDYQNLSGDPVIYTDYLAANAVTGVDVQVELFEEGDYEIALNYEIKDTGVEVFDKKFLSGYENYRIFFRFSVRNGNCMVFPFDSKTGAELTNSSVTENGFYLDLARSRYLDVDIKKEVMNDTADGLVEDVRFNRPARDGDVYEEEGIYTITVSNRYTGQQTVKKIYVGSNDILEAHVITGLSIPEVEDKINQGEKLIDDELVTDKRVNKWRYAAYIAALVLVLAVVVYLYMQYRKKADNQG